MKDRIKEIRTSLGLSQEEFAKQLSGVTLGVRILEETIKRWELGNETPLPSAIEALAHLSKQPIEWIQFNEDLNNKTNGSNHQEPNHIDVETKKTTPNSNVIQFPEKYDADQ